MNHRTKQFLYTISQSVLRMIRGVKGYRRIRCFGHDLRVSVATEFPTYWRLRLPTGNATSEIVRYGDYVQIHSICNYLSGLSHSAAVVEVGAHHGAYAVIIGKMVKHSGGKVIAIEPNEESFRILKHNIRLNDLEDTVFCEQVAISDREGTMHIAPYGSQTRVIKEQRADSITVRSVTMERLINQFALRSIDLLLIDVEGAELPVLRSIPWETVSIGKIFCELHPYAWKDFGYSARDVSDFLNMHDYQCIDMYLTEKTAFDDESYIGPTVLQRRSCIAEGSSD